MKRDELLNWMPHIEAEFDRRGLDTYAMLVSRATEMLQRDEETIAALEAERDQLRAEYAAYGVDMGRALDEVSRLRAELAVAGADLAVSVGHLSRLAEAYGCDDFTSAIDAALAAKEETK